MFFPYFAALHSGYLLDLELDSIRCALDPPPKSLVANTSRSAMLSKLDLLIDRWFGRSCFMPWAFALVCFATLNILISGIGTPGALPNHKNGPSLMVFGSNRTQITQALGLYTNCKTSFNLARCSRIKRGLELDVPHDAICFDNEIVSTVIHLRLQNLKLRNTPKPQQTHDLADKEMLDENLAVRRIERVYRGRHVMSKCSLPVGIRTMPII